jgi:predicted membrane protein (TIGR00267 family)
MRFPTRVPGLEPDDIGPHGDEPHDDGINSRLNALRAAVLGANDGLVSNASLVMGVAGAELAGRSILITGLAGLLAGSLSMALGEWLSVQSSRELYAHQIKIEREELLAAPEEEAEELGGSAWVAAATSFFLFSVGAIVPVAPYFFSEGTSAFVASIILSIIALFAIGAAITIITGRNALQSGLRQVLFGVAAAAITFVVGRAIGTSLGG